jgi:hypothetical protein
MVPKVWGVPPRGCGLFVQQTHLFGAKYGRKIKYILVSALLG